MRLAFVRQALWQRCLAGEAEKGSPPVERCLACEAVVNRENPLHKTLSPRSVLSFGIEQVTQD